MEPIIILVAFVGGLVASFLRLPPLTGFLVAGFALNFMGYELNDNIQFIADLGVTLLLFTIGLKLDVRSLLKAEIWGGATLHMLVTTAGITLLFIALKAVGWTALLNNMEWSSFVLIGFALSFSSTVFVVKMLEERSESQSIYGRIAIGVLVMQDIFAVIFLSASTGKVPSAWAILLLGLIPLAPLLRRLLDRLGHGEMQVLFGFLLSLVVGYSLFEALGVKGDLGALLVGMLLSTHRAAPGLAKSLFNIKELFLVAFFLSIGLMADPSWEHLAWAVGLQCLLPLQVLLFMVVLPRFRLRLRTSFLTSLGLGNYSEFGLIVASLAVTAGWLTIDWLVIIALAIALSFVCSAIANAYSERLYQRFVAKRADLPAEKLRPQDRPLDLGDAQAIVFGMGRIGRGAYQRLQDTYKLRVLGVDNNPLRIQHLQQVSKMCLAEGDASDSDFWEKLVNTQQIQLIVLAMPYHHGNVFALKQLKHRRFQGKIAAIVQYEEEVQLLRNLGANAIFYVYDGAGQALADSAMEELLANTPTSGSGSMSGSDSDRGTLQAS